MICTFFMPESPKFLITKNKYDEARKAIDFIARFNGCQVTFNQLFDREVIDRRTFIRLNHSNTSSISDISATPADSHHDTSMYFI